MIIFCDFRIFTEVKKTSDSSGSNTTEMVRMLSPSIAPNGLDTYSLDGSGVATEVAKITEQPSEVDCIEIAAVVNVTQVAESVESVPNGSLDSDGMNSLNTEIYLSVGFYT